MKKKIVLTSIGALSLALLVAVGVTVAYLFVETNPVENVFTPSNISIELEETERDYKMIPGITLPKDPKVTVVSDIYCYVFIKVDKTNNPDDYLEYAIASDWVQLKNADNTVVEGVYYYKDIVTSIKDISILVDDEVTVKASLTKGDMNDLYSNGSPNADAFPKLTFTAYAIQATSGTDSDGKATTFSPAEAWAEINKD